MATKSRVAIEVLARSRMQGAYDFWFDAYLFRTSGGEWLCIDEWCGEGSLEGECPRPHLYLIKPGHLDEVMEMFADDCNGYSGFPDCHWVSMRSQEYGILLHRHRVGRGHWLASRLDELDHAEISPQVIA